GRLIQHTATHDWNLFNFFRDCILFILYYLAGGGFGNSGYYSVFYAIAIHLDSACISKCYLYYF
ncbi:hypothetical protein, partial [uncultured Gammaproteobacteria bacterium]